MSNLSLFLKKNKTQRENTVYAPTKSLIDEKGNPLTWTIRPLTTSDTEQIREDCTIEVQITGKPGMYRQKVQSGKYLAKMLVASVVEPNLATAELQDSYGVKTPEALVKEMIDDPGEYNTFAEFVQNFNNLNVSMEDKVDEAKN